MKNVEIFIGNDGNCPWYLSTQVDDSSVRPLQEGGDFEEVQVIVHLEPSSFGFAKVMDAYTFVVMRGVDGEWSVADVDPREILNTTSPFSTRENFTDGDLRTLISVSIALVRAEMEPILKKDGGCPDRNKKESVDLLSIFTSLSVW